MGEGMEERVRGWKNGGMEEWRNGGMEEWEMARRRAGAMGGGRERRSGREMGT
jgi:hypothetical protein